MSRWVLDQLKLRGIDDDLNSRKDWTETYAQGIRLLGLMIEVPNISGCM